MNTTYVLKIRLRACLNLVPCGHESKGLKEQLLTSQSNGKWSIKEEVGHLLNLEPLWYIHDIKMGLEELRHADLSNAKTHEVGQNGRDISQIIADFNLEREKLMQLLSTVSETDLTKSALHPRLRPPCTSLTFAIFLQSMMIII